ncbi:11073_t:CDS:2 [Funneliformis geosporum]|uniref:2341_t:CDS:1 n=1 Tax=Funneliformis geosporum TaxID=1117311 RepID=A0A9W4X0P1_9GLOM|nr:2341_t:CDS:2 [Funneliformis geosporum]CAI2179516.1 11073_t:CDS:2 [Funneliformis geosporum]
MANNNSLNTSNSQQIQYNSIGVPIQPQQGQPRDKTQQSSLESEKRQKKGTPKRKMENEREKHKAELEKFEKSGNELNRLMSQYGTKAKAKEELDNDAQRIRNNISALMTKVQAKANKPMQPVVHGTFGVDQSMSLGIVWSVVNSIRDFVAEVMNGGRGFGSPSYDGFVPI